MTRCLLLSNTCGHNCASSVRALSVLLRWYDEPSTSNLSVRVLYKRSIALVESFSNNLIHLIAYFACLLDPWKSSGTHHNGQFFADVEFTVFLTISQTEKSHGKQTKQTTFFKKIRPKTDHFFRKFPKKQTYINFRQQSSLQKFMGQNVDYSRTSTQLN